MLSRLWHLLEPFDRARIVRMVPLLVLVGFVEIAGIAAVIPFITLLADPGAAADVPLFGAWIAASTIDDDIVLLRWAGVALAALLVTANGLVMLTNWRLYRLSWSLNHRLSSRLLRHYLAQPYAVTLTYNTAELGNKVMNEVRRLVESGYLSALEILSRGIVIAVVVVFLVVLDPLLALSVFVGLGGAYVAVFLVSRRYLRRIGHESVALGKARLTAVNEAMGGFKDLKLSGRESSAFRAYDRPSERHAEVEAAHDAISMLPRYALEAIAVGGMVLFAAAMSGRSGMGQTMLPLLGVYAFAGLRLMPLMQQLFAAFSRSRFAEGALATVGTDLLRADAGEGDLEAVPSAATFERSIVLRDVRFTYAGERTPVIDGLSLEIPTSTSIALVGRTGSGKTTLMDLLLGLLVPESGTVELDGVPVTAEGRRSYRRLFGHVPQHVYLLDDTVARNVALGLGDDDIDMEAVRRACRMAQIATFIEEELPNGYDSLVGERGVRLSGGQLQRIGIARALYHQPQVLVLDEATSALDMHTERQLFEALETLAQSHTIVTIAHRLETVAMADSVIVLDRGRIVDRGPPAEVLNRYRHLQDATAGQTAEPARTP